MVQLKYTEDNLYSELAFAKPHEACGQRLHGGLDAKGQYLPPRAKGRNEALNAWAEALRERGGDLFDAQPSLLSGPQMPNLAQHQLLLREGVGKPFWNMLTTIGKIEVRGRLLAEMQFPDLQDILVEDVSEMALGHLNTGLLAIHGIDEGGEPDKGIGGHDVMWFVVRDMVFDAGAYPDVEPPETISRPESDRRWMPEIPPEYEGLLSLLLNLLIIEFRAENGFINTQKILRTTDLFTDRREAAEEAAEIIERIRTDEEIHVRSLQIYLGELRELTIKKVDGGTIKGSELIDRFWGELVQWATVEQPKLNALAELESLTAIIREHPNSESILPVFLELGDIQPSA